MRTEIFSFSLLLFEGDEFLTDEVEDGIEDGAGEGGNILLQGFGFAGKELKDQGLCDAVGKHGAYRHYGNEEHDLLKALFVIAEGEVFIEEIAHNTAGYIVCGNAQPIGSRRKIEQQKHYSVADKGVYNADDKKSYRLRIKKFFYKVFHLSPRAQSFL